MPSLPNVTDMRTHNMIALETGESVILPNPKLNQIATQIRKALSERQTGATLLCDDYRLECANIKSAVRSLRANGYTVTQKRVFRECPAFIATHGPSRWELRITW